MTVVLAFCSGRRLVVLVTLVQMLSDMWRRSLHAHPHLQQPPTSLRRRHLPGTAYRGGSVQHTALPRYILCPSFLFSFLLFSSLLFSSLFFSSLSFPRLISAQGLDPLSHRWICRAPSLNFSLKGSRCSPSNGGLWLNQIRHPCVCYIII